MRRGGGRTEYWIRRESLNRWIANRDLELARYMSRSEAQRTLGLKNITVMAVAQAGLIRYAKGAEHYFPAGFHFLREDVIRIKNAFEKHVAPEREYSKPGTLIALRHALKNYLGRDTGLPAVIRAVVDGDLVPVGYTKRFPGITGYLFPSELLRRYRPVSGVRLPLEEFLNYSEAGALLGVKTAVIRGLVAHGILNAHEWRNGFAKLVPADDIQRFAEQHMSVPVLAKLLKLDFRSLRPFLRRAGTPVLTIPVIGKGQTFFVHKEMAMSLIDSCQ